MSDASSKYHAPADADAMDNEEFRTLFRSWLEAFYPEEWKQNERRPFFRLRGDDQKRWLRMLCDGGWRCPAWPKEHGGMALGFDKQLIYQEEMQRICAARVVDNPEAQLGPTIMTYGTEAQKKRFLPPMFTGEELWCQGYSEPGSGSDLASLRTSAVREGDQFRVNGQKIWTSHAQEAVYMYGLVRTSKMERKQQGITFILIDMKSPGITIRPIPNLAGEEEFCEVFFDDVMVPVENAVGPVDEGWTVAKALLGYERLWIGSPGQVGRAMDLARQLLAAGNPDQALTDRYAECRSDLHDLTALYRKFCDQTSDGREPGPEASMLKVIASELLQRVTELNLELGGEMTALHGDVVIGNVVTDLSWQYFMARPPTIYAGSNEVQRNVLAKAVLGLGRK